MVDYVETPWDLIVGVHWASPPPPNCHDNPDQFLELLAPRVGNVYGSGCIRTSTKDDPFTGTPYGDLILPPFTGAFSTVGFNGPDSMLLGGDCGGLNHPYVDGDGNLIASTLDLTGSGHAFVQAGLTVGAQQMAFTTPNLSADGDLGDGTNGNVSAVSEDWLVPLSAGHACMQHAAVPQFPPIVGPDGRPVRVYPSPRYFVDSFVVDTIRFELAWQIAPDPSFPEEEMIGLSLTHPFSVGNFSPPSPLGLPLGGGWPGLPNAGFGPLAGGAIDFTYNFRYQDWLNRELDSNLRLGHPFYYDESNFQDLSIGGPVACWIVHNSVSGGFTYNWPPQVLIGVGPYHFSFGAYLRGLNDWMTWKITTTVKPGSLALTPIDGVSYS